MSSLMYDANGVPAELKNGRPCFVLWQYGKPNEDGKGSILLNREDPRLDGVKPRKIPLNPNGSPITGARKDTRLHTFAEADRHAQALAASSGIRTGVMLLATRDAGLARLDFDKGLWDESGNATPLCDKIVKDWTEAGAYVERSPSGNLRVIARSADLNKKMEQVGGEWGALSKPDPDTLALPNFHTDFMEFYADEMQFVTITGNAVNKVDTIANCDGLIWHYCVASAFISLGKEHKTEFARLWKPSKNGKPVAPPEDVTDELVAKTAEKVDFSSIDDGNESRRDWKQAIEAVKASGGNVELAERIMRLKGTHRPKWDEPRGAVSYLRYTINQVIKKIGIEKLLESTGRKPLRIVTALDLFKSDVKQEVIIKDILPKDFDFTLIGAPAKGRKTDIGIAMCVAIASGKPFLNHFAVEQPGPVLYLSVEVGQAGFKDRLMRIARFHDAEEGLADNFDICFDRFALDDKEWRAGFEDRLKEREYKVCIFDSWYRMQGKASSAQSTAAETAYLVDPVLDICRDNGCVPVFMLHFNKGEWSPRKTPADLNAISYSGPTQMARHSILLNHRKRFDAVNNTNEINLTVMSNDMVGGTSVVNIDEGPRRDRWECTVSPYDAAEAAEKEADAQASAAEDPTLISRIEQVLVENQAAQDGIVFAVLDKQTGDKTNIQLRGMTAPAITARIRERDGRGASLDRVNKQLAVLANRVRVAAYPGQRPGSAASHYWVLREADDI